MLTDLKNRGVKDVFFLVCDGLKDLPEAMETVWPLAGRRQPIMKNASYTLNEINHPTLT